MTEGEKEIMVHIMAIEAFLANKHGLTATEWNEVLEEIRKMYMPEE